MDFFIRIMHAVERIAIALERQNEISEAHLRFIKEEWVRSDVRLKKLYAKEAALTPLHGDEQ